MNQLQIPDPPPLPDPPVLEMYLFENPYPLAIGLLVIGFAAHTLLRRGSAGRGEPGPGSYAPLSIAVLGALGVYLASVLVTTHGERVKQRSLELVDAVATADTASVRGLLAEDAILSPGEGLGRIPSATDRAQIIDAVERSIGPVVRVREHTVRSVTASIDGPDYARTQLMVRVTVESALFTAPNGSWWRLHWRLENPGDPEPDWRVIQIEPVFIQGLSSR